MERENKDERKTKEYRNWRKAVLERDLYTCKNCDKSDVKLHAHHIKEFAKYKDLRFEVGNGMTLCEECHRLKHKKEVIK